MAVFRHWHTRVARGAVLVAAGIGAVVASTGGARAAGLQLLEVSPRLTGTAYAGTAAWAADASMAYFNPAGLTRLEGGSLVAAGYVFDVRDHLSVDKATTWGQSVTGPGGSMDADGGSTAAIPQFHIAQRISDRWVAYLGVTVPFGNQTNYPDDSAVRYIATLSELRTININPALAWKPLDELSIGVGFNAQVVRAHLNQKLAIPTFPIMPQLDVNSLIFGDDWAFGWNIGLLYELTSRARVGIAYRSAVHHTLTGPVNLILPERLAPLLGSQVSGTARMGLTAPDSLIVSGFWTVFPWLDVMGDFQWTRWSIFQQLSVQVDVPSLPAPIQQLVGGSTINDSVYEGFRDGFRGTLGVQVRPSERWTLRFGSGFDGSPVHDANRTVRLPDANRVLLALGFGVEVLDGMYLDFGWSHFFARDGRINETNQTADRSHVVATVQGSADVFGAQFTYNWKNLPWQDLPSL